MQKIHESGVYIIDNFLSDEECTTFMKQISDKKKTYNFTSLGNFKNDKYIDSDLAETFFQRIQTHIGSPNDCPKILRAGSLIMTGKYKPGQYFGIHTDTGLFYSVEAKEKSRYTLLCYCNDDFEGGQTQFFDTQTWKPTVCVQPRKGRALIFDIDLWHQGLPLDSGKKYWIGCELIGKMEK